MVLNHFELETTDNDLYDIQSDYIGHIFNHDINNISDISNKNKKIDVTKLYNEKETFVNKKKKNIIVNILLCILTIFILFCIKIYFYKV